MAVRAILGQQVSVRNASTLAGRFAGAFGERDAIDLPGVTHTFPTAARLAGADLRNIGLPTARAEAIRNLARAVPSGSSCSTAAASSSGDRDAQRAHGIGAWTAPSRCVARSRMRSRQRDLGVRKALATMEKRPVRLQSRAASNGARSAPTPSCTCGEISSDPHRHAGRFAN